ncbi:hypothetical protein Tco_1135878 [Tanacetum coccineum]
MADKEEGQGTTPRGADWEVVSLTTSACAAAPEVPDHQVGKVDGSEYVGINLSGKEQSVYGSFTLQSLHSEATIRELGDIELVRVKLPKKLKKRRHIEIDDGPAGYEEYIDYLFTKESQAPNLKILEQAYKWKKQKVAYDDEDDDDDDDDEDDVLINIYR